MCRMKSLQKSTGDTQHLISTSELITCEPGAPVPFLILFCQANGIKETMWAATMHLSCQLNIKPTVQRPTLQQNQVFNIKSHIEPAHNKILNQKHEHFTHVPRCLVHLMNARFLKRYNENHSFFFFSDLYCHITAVNPDV